jgi:hypothetical protein
LTNAIPAVLLAACLAWPQAGASRSRIRVSADPLSGADIASREALPTPGIVARAGVASPTRAPWIVANGWRFTRNPGGTYRYDLAPGKALLAAAEAFAYGADAMLKVDPAEAASVEGLLAFLDGLPAVDPAPVADLAVVDDGSAATGEVMNLLARRNLLYAIVKAPSQRFPINVAVGSPEYPAADAADPSAFALKVRRQLTDERRSLRIFGSEVVIGRLTGDGRRMRLHLINYGGREIDGLRVRLRDAYPAGHANVPGAGRVALLEHGAADGATEFTLARFGVYAVVDLAATR